MTRTDSDLVTAARGGDRDAFAAIVERHQRAVVAVVYAVTGDGVLAEDIAQDVFVVAWRELARLADPGKLAAWLCGIARKQALHTLRWRRREAPFDVEPVAATTPFEQLAEHEREHLVTAALARVPETYRDALALYYGDGRSADGVARALGISVDAANQRLSRGRAHLAADAAIAVERQLASRPRRDLVAGVLAAIAGARILAASGSASASASAAVTATAATGARAAQATGVSKLVLAAAATAVLAGTGFLAASARATAAPGAPAASADRLAGSAAPAPSTTPPPAPQSAEPALPSPPPDDDPPAVADPADEDPALACDALGDHFAALVAAGEPADAYHALRSPDWIHQKARQVAGQCEAWSLASKQCVAAAASVYDVIYLCPDIDAPVPLSLGRHVEPEAGDDLDCGHVAAHVASLFELDPDRLATVPPAWRANARSAYEEMRRDEPERTRRECETAPWSETTRRCYLLTTSDYRLGCAQ